MSCGRISLSHQSCSDSPTASWLWLKIKDTERTVHLVNCSFLFFSIFPDSVNIIPSSKSYTALNYSYTAFTLQGATASIWIHVNPCQARVRIFTKPARLKHGPRIFVTARYSLLESAIPHLGRCRWCVGVARHVFYISRRKKGIEPQTRTAFWWTFLAGTW